MTDAERAAEKLQVQVGRLHNVTVRQIDAGMVTAFAEATGDASPLYRDPEIARRGPWGGIIAPPTFVGTIRGDTELADVEFGSATLNGGESYELFLPVRVGDVITAVETVEAVRAARGRSGQMLIITMLTEYRNASNDIVARRRSTVIKR